MRIGYFKAGVLLVLLFKAAMASAGDASSIASCIALDDLVQQMVGGSSEKILQGTQPDDKPCFVFVSRTPDHGAFVFEIEVGPGHLKKSGDGYDHDDQDTEKQRTRISGTHAACQDFCGGGAQWSSHFDGADISVSSAMQARVGNGPWVDILGTIKIRQQGQSVYEVDGLSQRSDGAPTKEIICRFGGPAIS